MLNAVRAVAVTVIALTGVTQVAQAAEVSLVSGLYRTESNESGGVDAGKKTTIDAGGRWSDQLDSQMFWFGQGMLTMRSYDKGDLAEAPSSSTSLSLGGGVRYYFTKLSESISPFAYGIGQYKSEEDGELGTGVEHETNGLFYGASFGIRLSLGTDFFVDLETPLFESALFATTKTTTPTTSGTPPTTTNVESESKKTELYVNTTGALSSVVIAMGMRL